MKDIITIIFIWLLSISSLYAQNGSVTRNYIMHGKKIGNTVTLNLVNGSLTSFSIGNNCNRDSDNNIVVIYNTISQNKWLVPHFSTFVKNFKRAKEKYVEWDSIAKANNVKEFSKDIEVIEKNDPPLWIKWKYPYKGEMAYSYYYGGIPGYKVLGDAHISVRPSFIVNQGNHLFYYRLKLDARVYENSTQEPIYGAQYNNYTYLTREVLFIFFNSEELQSFIDALDIESAKRILLERNKNEQKVDDLFK